MNAENVKSQMRKGTLEYCILLLLKKEPAYTFDIIQKLQEAKLIVVEGTLYPLLTRLKNSETSRATSPVAIKIPDSDTTRYTAVTSSMTAIMAATSPISGSL